jgi:hypothetical protein
MRGDSTQPLHAGLGAHQYPYHEGLHYRDPPGPP